MWRNRIIWLVLWIISLVGISFYGGNISYGFFYVMTAIPVISLLYLGYVIIFFRIYQYTEGRDFVVNDAVPYSFRLMNEFRLPFAGIRVRFYEPLSTINELSDETEYELMPGTGITRETTLVCHYRGEYEVGIKETQVQDFFRLFKITYRNREPKRVTVLPQIVQLDNLGSQEMQVLDSLNKPSKLDIVTREYVPGDDVRFINWSQTARTGTLMTRERISEEGSGVGIIMEANRLSKDPYVYLPIENKMLELVIALSLFLVNKGVGVKVNAGDTDNRFMRVDTHAQFEGLYQKLSAIMFDARKSQENQFEGLINSEELLSCSVVYMVLQQWTKAADAMLEKLTKHNIHTVIYLVGTSAGPQLDAGRFDLVDVVVISQDDKLEEVLQ